MVDQDARDATLEQRAHPCAGEPLDLLALVVIEAAGVVRPGGGVDHDERDALLDKRGDVGVVGFAGGVVVDGSFADFVEREPEVEQQPPGCVRAHLEIDDRDGVPRADVLEREDPRDHRLDRLGRTADPVPQALVEKPTDVGRPGTLVELLGGEVERLPAHAASFAAARSASARESRIRAARQLRTSSIARPTCRHGSPPS